MVQRASQQADDNEDATTFVSSQQLALTFHNLYKVETPLIRFAVDVLDNKSYEVHNKSKKVEFGC